MEYGVKGYMVWYANRMLVVRSSSRAVVSTSVVVPLLVVSPSAVMVLVVDVVLSMKEAMIVLAGVVTIRGYDESSESTADPPLSAACTHGS